MPLTIYNSLTRQKEDFVPLEEGQVGIYVCGPTVYGHSHVGHAKSYICFDTIIKWFRRAYRVRYVQNITDVGHLTDDADEGEDKIGRRARLDQVHPLALVDQYMRSYFEDMEALGIAHPDMYVRATQHIGEQIEMIETLIERGHAYEADGNVYFDVASWPEYGVLSGRKTEDQIEGTRVEARSDKRDPRDFALWKSAEGTRHALRWRSPWGQGYPGWHIECSAMSTKYLGDTFDIHGGGNDNKFPHHECEIAQSRATGRGTFARYWLHNNMVTVDSQKMGKSLGNAILVKDVLSHHRAQAVRHFILQTHYRRPSNFTDDGLRASESAIDRLGEVIALLERACEEGPEAGAADDGLRRSADETRATFTRWMDDDFNTALAIAALFEHAKAVNRCAAEGIGRDAATESLALFVDLAGDSLLGILPGRSGTAGREESLVEPIMRVVLEVRGALRERKDWETSDLIRDRLLALGIEIKDEKDGVRWSRSNG